MQIFFRTANNKTITIEVENDDTFGEIRKRIKEKEGIPEQFQFIIFNGGDIPDNSSLSSLNIFNQHTFHLLHRPRSDN